MNTQKNILVLNSGSSSLKFGLISMPEGMVQISGLAERLGTQEANLTIHQSHKKIVLPKSGSHAQALEAIVAQLNPNTPIHAVGHRVVHGGEDFTRSCLITEPVISAIERLCKLAPLHNPANLSGINSARQMFKDVPHFAVFDTSFHQSLPPEAFTYALPQEMYQKHGIRRYGFHGTSHRYVSDQARHWLKPGQNKLITAHLGNGSSICAVSAGRSLDTSMGLSPLEGLVMGTRCGDVDPSLTFYLIEELGYSIAEVRNMYNKQSGLLGLSGRSNDCRELLQASSEGDASARLALDVFAYRASKYIASYLVPLGGLDALIFTGGIGENAAEVRSLILKRLSPLGIKLDLEANLRTIGGQAGLISVGHAPAVLVIPTNEELMIAKDSFELMHEGFI